MATYCNIDDVKLRIDYDTYITLTDDEGTLTGDALTTAIIAKVDAYMRDVFAKAYTDVTLLEGSTVVNELCVELVLCSLYKRREKNGVLMTDTTKENCSNAELLLDNIGSGKEQIYNNGVLIAIKVPEVALSVDVKTFADMENPNFWYNGVDV